MPATGGQKKKITRDDLAFDLNNEVRSVITQVNQETDNISIDVIARFITTTNIDLTTTLATYDGLTPASGDIVCVNGQTDKTENAIYQYTGSDFTNLSLLVCGMLVKIKEGTANRDTIWMLISDNLSGDIEFEKKSVSVTDTNTIDLTYSNGVISGNVRYEDSNSINLSDSASGLKADLIIQDSNTIDLTVNASGLKGDVRYQDTNTVDLADDASGLKATVKYQDSTTVNLSDDASGLKAEVIAGGINHNSTALIQGGTTNEYYHLTQSEHDNIILKTLINSKGDLLAGSANDTIGRLGVGSNNTVLTADSNEAFGMRWATPSDTYEQVNAETLAADKTLSNTDKKYQLLATGNTVYILTLGVTSMTDKVFIIRNTSAETATGYLKIRVAGDGTDYDYVYPGQIKEFSWNGSAWKGTHLGSRVNTDDMTGIALGYRSRGVEKGLGIGWKARGTAENGKAVGAYTIASRYGEFNYHAEEDEDLTQTNFASSAMWCGVTENANGASLNLEGSATAGLYTVPASCLIGFRGHIVAMRTTAATEYAHWTIDGCIKNVAGTSMVFVTSTNNANTFLPGTTVAATMAADGTNNALIPSVSAYLAVGSVSVNWTIFLHLTEVHL